MCLLSFFPKISDLFVINTLFLLFLSSLIKSSAFITVPLLRFSFNANVLNREEWLFDIFLAFFLFLTINCHGFFPTQLILISDDGSIILPGGGQSVNLQGGTNVQTKVESGNLKINVTGSGLVELDTSPKLGGNLDADGNNITNGGTVTASNFNGALEGLVYGIDIRNISSSLIDFDMGGVELTATNVMDFIILTTDYDMGTYASPQAVSIEGGTI